MSDDILVIIVDHIESLVNIYSIIITVLFYICTYISKFNQCTVALHIMHTLVTIFYTILNVFTLYFLVKQMHSGLDLVCG